MKVTVKTLTKEESNSWDYRQVLSIFIDGQKLFRVSDGEPEDSNLARDFRDCYKISDLMKRAYEAGKNGEEFEIVYEEVTLDELW